MYSAPAAQAEQENHEPMSPLQSAVRALQSLSPRKAYNAVSPSVQRKRRAEGGAVLAELQLPPAALQTHAVPAASLLQLSNAARKKVRTVSPLRVLLPSERRVSAAKQQLAATHATTALSFNTGEPVAPSTDKRLYGKNV
jgi:hypothetical protein